MRPEDFAAAAMDLQAGAARVAIAGFPGGLGAGMAAHAALAGGCTGLFLARPPLAPGAVICGASHAPLPGLRAHAAGIGPTPQAAFARAMGEVAEARALYRRPDDPRLAGDGRLPVLDARLRPAGRIAPDGLLRDPGGAVDGTGLGAGPDAATAARSAWHEATERHAIALWFTGEAPARPLPAPPAALALEAALRGASQAPGLRYMLLPGAPAGLVVIAALSTGPWGVIPGYGCAATPAEAACKAVTEAVMGEFALHLEQRALHEQGIAPPAGGFGARAALLAGRPDLTDPDQGPAPAPGPHCRPRFAVLSLPGDGLVVLRALAPGLRVPMGPPGPV